MVPPCNPNLLISLLTKIEFIKQDRVINTIIGMLTSFRQSFFFKKERLTTKKLYINKKNPLKLHADLT
ncbi:hypothetical protein D3C81_2292300 [compost metagenome]